MYSSNASAVVFHPRVFRGLLLSALAVKTRDVVDTRRVNLIAVTYASAANFRRPAVPAELRESGPGC